SFKISCDSTRFNVARTEQPSSRFVLTISTFRFRRIVHNAVCCGPALGLPADAQDSDSHAGCGVGSAGGLLRSSAEFAIGGDTNVICRHLWRQLAFSSSRMMIYICWNRRLRGRGCHGGQWTAFCGPGLWCACSETAEVPVVALVDRHQWRQERDLSPPTEASCVFIVIRGDLHFMEQGVADSEPPKTDNERVSCVRCAPHCLQPPPEVRVRARQVATDGDRNRNRRHRWRYIAFSSPRI